MGAPRPSWPCSGAQADRAAHRGPASRSQSEVRSQDGEVTAVDHAVAIDVTPQVVAEVAPGRAEAQSDDKQIEGIQSTGAKPEPSISENPFS